MTNDTPWNNDSSLSNPDDMAEVALKLLDLGYVPLRLDKNTKAAKSTGWQVKTPTKESIARDFARPSNIGVRTGDIKSDGTCLLAIDVDIDDASLIRCVEQAVGERVPVKRGKKGATYFIRSDREVKTHKITMTRDVDGKTTKRQVIDVLCTGAQTVIPPSIHPDTDAPYRWIAGDPLYQVDYRTLPVFGPSVLDEIRGYCKNPDDPIYALNNMEWAGVGGGGNTHDICLSAVASMVARNWTDEDIHSRIERAKREACEVAGMPYNWPDSYKVIQEWVDSSRDKKFDKTTRKRLSEVPLDVLNRYVYVVSVNRLYDLNKGVMLAKEVFDNVHARDMPKPWLTLMTHPDLRQVDKITYSPGQPRFCKEMSFDSDAVMDCLNVYTDRGIEPTEGDVEPFVQLIKDVCDNQPEAYDHVFKFFAYAVQNPGCRINHALVLQGDQGIGKDSILHAMKEVFGIQNVSEVTLQHVESNFNEWLFGKQLIVFQEMLATGRRSIYNRLKTYITDPVHTINTKFVTLQRIPNRSIYVFLTNYKHALSIDHSDRRTWVWHSKMSRRSPKYYEDYYKWLHGKNTASHLLYWLLQYDTNGFNPSAAPPMTLAKQELIDASSPEIEQYLRQAADSGLWPMAYDLISVPHLYGAIRPFMRTSLAMLNEALDRICEDTGGGALNTRPRIGNARIRVRAIRNYEKWKDADAPTLKAAYRMPLPPQSGETEGGYTVYNSEGQPHDADGPDY